MFLNIFLSYRKEVFQIGILFATFSLYRKPVPHGVERVGCISAIFVYIENQEASCKRIGMYFSNFHAYRKPTCYARKDVGCILTIHNKTGG